jgi:preprotein translocase subunit SecD
LIGQTPFLEFREENPNPQTSAPDKDGNVQVDANNLFLPTGLTGKELARSTLEFDQRTGAPQIILQFNDEGKQKFAEITQKNLNRRVAIFLDGEIISAPTVQGAITDGRAVISGQFTLTEAKELVTRLNSGALPVPIKLIEQQNVGATLGLLSVKHSVAAGIIGFAMIALFMILYYRLPGLLAVLALAVYVAISWPCLSSLALH